jgi:hypothetical protein
VPQKCLVCRFLLAIVEVVVGCLLGLGTYVNKCPNLRSPVSRYCCSLVATCHRCSSVRADAWLHRHVH